MMLTTVKLAVPDIPKRVNKPSKVLIIGSGPIVIGQAAEFDYAGTQACKAMREEGVVSVLVNSNPATIMTDEGVADVVYIEPITVDVITRIIERERPDGLLPTLGGQTGLNMAVALHEAGVLDTYNVRLLGTPLEAIRKAEDRELFRADARRDRRADADVRHRHDAATKRARALDEIGLPAVIRPAYTLGGTGGGIAHTRRGVRAHRRRRHGREPDRARCSSSSRCSAGRKSSTR